MHGVEQLSLALPALMMSAAMHSQVDANKESIVQISLEATQEAALEASLAQVNSKVFALEIPITPYKDYKDAYTLGNLEHMTTVLDDSIMTVATILASRQALFNSLHANNCMDLASSNKAHLRGAGRSCTLIK